ncbi:Proline iminopeptidase [Candidatus Zixiibacteriota bacterium]|nr:Proline iminopeptidase [candidate division Zixibacteria bacterium]
MERKGRGMKEMKLAAMLAVMALTVAAGMARAGELVSKEGFVDVDGGKVWYRMVGSGAGTPLLILHGGPGVPSYYLKPLAALGDERPVVFFDQLGCGHSPAENDSSLWTINQFVKQVGDVRKALGLKEIYLFGHSWGTILAAEYMFTKPEGVRGLILASPALDIPRWGKDAEKLLAGLPDSVQSVIHKHEADGTTDAPEYQNAVMAYYFKYLARRQPWSADIDSSFAQINPALYNYMNGPSEFALTGTLINYDCTHRLHELTVPVLFTAGEFDEAVPSTVAYFEDLVPHSEMATFKDCGHLTMQDDSTHYVEAVRKFLRKLDK